MRCRPPSSFSCFSTGVLEKALKLAGTSTVSLKVARNDGSSQLGSRRRASVGSMVVAIMVLSAAPTLYFMWNMPRASRLIRPWNFSASR